MSTYTIGGVSFITFPYPAQALARRETETETRAGVDYHSTWVTGVRGRPQKMLAEADASDWAAGQAFIQSVYNLIGTTVVIVHNGDELPHYFDVLDVEPAGENGGLQPVIGSSGGLAAGAALVRLTITIIETDIDVPAPEEPEPEPDPE
jgi:hypothetical protein